MFQPNLSSLPEHSVNSDKHTHKPHLQKSRLKPVETKSGQNQNVTKPRTSNTHQEKKLPVLNRMKQFQHKAPTVRASISEGFPLSEINSKKQTTLEPVSSSAVPPRRTSFPLAKKSGTMLFAGLGRKVTSMVRARWAFQSNRKPRDEILESDSMEAIHEMPKAPRFSSFFSPEAQYAMMMGYEDVLHQQLASNHPEYKSVLRRNKTPMFNVGIVKMKVGKMTGMPRTDEEGEEGDDAKEDGEQKEEEEEDEDRLTQAKEDDVDDIWKSDFRNMHQKSNVPAATTPTTTLRSRSRTTPQKIPFDRRLHLTYRMESAMDILDTIRRRHGQPPISPRVRANKREIAPIRDYNSWTNVWKKEFSSCGDKKSPQKVKV